MIQQSELAVGKQVLYAPEYVREECEYDVDKYIDSPYARIGFVTSWHDEVAFCRFFDGKSPVLRTLDSSEECLLENLLPYKWFSRIFIEEQLAELRAEPEKYGWHEQPEGRRE